MMTRLSAVAAVVAAATLAHQGSADMPPVENAKESDGGGGEEAEYLGCFHDNKGDRVLGDKETSSDMTTKVCLEYCTDLGSAFMATQYGFECWCSPDGGLDYNRHYDVVGEDAVCDMDCMGDKAEICGGYDSFSLYKLVPASGCSGTPVEAYEQCGGSDWTGSTCCSDGHECTDMVDSGCYSQCRPISTDETTPPPIDATGEPSPSPVSTEEPTPSPIAPEPVAPAPEPETPAPVAPPVADPAPEPVPTNADDCMVVIIEGEDLALTGAWSVVQDSAASGSKYIVWQGLTESDNNSSPDNGDIISTSIEIAIPGTYSFKWLMRQPAGVESDKANDTWLYFPDADRFGPKGKSSSYGTFIKVFGNAVGSDFKYSGTAEEANHSKSQIAVEFAEAGRYTMEISGRSHGHEIDQIILFGESLSVEDASSGCE